MGRSPCCSKEGLNRGTWTALEDKILTDYIKIHGEGRWRNLPIEAGLKRCGKSCRLRWLNYLRPDIKRGNISHDEEELIIRLHRLLGNRWSLIAGRLPGRTDNEIKNYWNTNLRKKVQDHSTSTSIHNYSNQSKEKKEKPGTRRSVEAPRQPPPEIESHVVKTKALRCTKLSFTLQPCNVERLETNTAVRPALESCDGLSSFTPLKDNSFDFIMDLNMGDEHFLPELLNSDFSQLCDFDNVLGEECNNNYNKDLLPSSDHPFLFPDENLEDWTGNECVQPDVASDLQSLAAFLDSEENWLGE